MITVVAPVGPVCVFVVCFRNKGYTPGPMLALLFNAALANGGGSGALLLPFVQGVGVRPVS